MIVNVMEEVVEEVLKRYRTELKLCCDCQHCTTDVKALALNDLTPKYVTNPNHSVYVRAVLEGDPQEVTKLLSVVTRAASKVSANPRCSANSTRE
ncbi:late competence development ComFB family protein [Savagea sp. SN6]|uniref:Late competence development ComFB family protein n=1 Tax=Savagea serpentis TaxID=2785297 RepID=A0A8J7GCQ6_9BACL|nr:late competence development ComFB family protein [Savagea serpentis]MBF4501306.1 late competence development ComFB family protein [Savagea serpentis]